MTDSSVIAEIRDQYIALAKASGNAVAAAWMPHHFDRIDSTLRSLEKMRAAAEPVQLEALATFAARAYRRPLTKAERDGLLVYYQKLRKQSALSHEDAMRDSVASILISPVFLYRVDLRDPARGVPGLASSHAAIPLSGYELASRLSYFLWSSMPDQELLNHAAAGDLSRRDVLIAQTRRMLKDPRVARPGHRVRRELARFAPFRNVTIPWIANASRPSPTICERRCSRSRSGLSKT